MAKSAHDITRKEMKAPDRFQVVAGRAAGWLAKHQKTIVAVVGGAMVLMLVGGAVSIFQDSRDGKAAGLYYEVADAMAAEVTPSPPAGSQEKTFKTEQEKQRAVIASAEAVRKAFPSSRAAESATLALADAHLGLGENDAAVQAYRDYLARAPGSDSLRFGALEGLAYALEGKGDVAGAVAELDRLGQEAPAFKARGALEKARLLAKQGKAEEAKNILKGFPKDFAGSTLQMEAQAMLDRMGPSAPEAGGGPAPSKIPGK